MKGGGLEGVSSAIYLFWKMIFFKTIKGGGGDA